MPVTPADIAVALGRATPAEDSADFKQWDLWIGDALLLIEARLGDPSDLDQAKLDYVVREAVVAQVRRPDDATSVDVRVDDGAVSKTYRSSAGRVTIIDAWWNLLAPPDSSSGAFSIVPTGCSSIHADICSANTYVDANGAIMFGGAYCTCGADIAGEPIYEI